MCSVLGRWRGQQRGVQCLQRPLGEFFGQLDEVRRADRALAAQALDQIISLGALGGSLLADGVQSDLAAEFITDLVSREGRVHLSQRKPAPNEIGRAASSIEGAVMVRRAGGDPLCGVALQNHVLEPLDEMLCMRYTTATTAAAG